LAALAISLTNCQQILVAIDKTFSQQSLFQPVDHFVPDPSFQPEPLAHLHIVVQIGVPA
jgi:hypothetical protein